MSQTGVSYNVACSMMLEAGLNHDQIEHGILKIHNEHAASRTGSTGYTTVDRVNKEIVAHGGKVSTLADA